MYEARDREEIILINVVILLLLLFKRHRKDLTYTILLYIIPTQSVV